MMASQLTAGLEQIATDIDEREVDGQIIVDFDIDLGTEHDAGHEVQSQLTIEGDRVVGGVVRFGEAPLSEDENIDVAFLERRLLKACCSRDDPRGLPRSTQ